jgi:hypothetical protein
MLAASQSGEASGTLLIRHWLEKIKFGAVVFFMACAVSALFLGSHLTTPRYQLIEPQLTWLTFGGGTIGVVLITAFFGILFFQLFNYFHRWSHRLYEKFGVQIFYILSFCFDAISVVFLFLGLIVLYVIFCLVLLQTTVLGLNVHFDSSKPIQVQTQIIEKRNSGSLKRGFILRMKIWDRQTQNQNPSFHMDQRIFRVDMDYANASFYVRNGAFGWPYAVALDFAEKK